MKIEILSRARKKRFVEGLSDLGVEKISGMLVRGGKEKVRLFSGSLTREDVLALWRVLPVEGIGLYVGKDSVNRRTGEREVRATLDGLHVWKDEIKGRVIELTEEQEKAWFLGEDLDLTDEQGEIGIGFVAVRGGVDFVGVGKVSKDGKNLISFLPKERRRRERAS